MKYIIIGGTGLIGKKLVEILKERGHQVQSASPSSGVNTVTGEGLKEALTGADVVVDVSNAPSWEDNAVLAFFQTSQQNLAAAEKAAGVKHHIALSIVGAERLPDNGYLRAKVAQEALIKKSGIPFTIVRATQFFEFLNGIADSSMKGNEVHLSTGAIQPIAAEEVSAALADIAEAAPLNGTTEIAGPQRFALAELVRDFLNAKGDKRKVVGDPETPYFGGKLDDQSIVPIGEARLGKISFEQWMGKQDANL
jgi:uncharacterized protein YbjT (DUF2867 family)